MTTVAAGSSTLLGIDLGTSSVKVVLLDLDGSLLSTTTAAYPVDRPQPGWARLTRMNDGNACCGTRS